MAKSTTTEEQLVAAPVKRKTASAAKKEQRGIAVGDFTLKEILSLCSSKHPGENTLVKSLSHRSYVTGIAGENLDAVAG